jgi:hypothetical protein
MTPPLDVIERVNCTDPRRARKSSLNQVARLPIAQDASTRQDIEFVIALEP